MAATTDLLRRIGSLGIIPVVVIENEDDAEPLAGALLEGGLPTMEVTFRTAAAPKVLKRISKTYPDILLGAGTVLTVEQAQTARECGASYIVSPGLSPKIVSHCLGQGIPVLPGVVTPTEVALALELGITTAKFFPAEASGGLPYLKAISAPFRQMRFIPTGGIDESNLLSYLGFDRVHACGGSWMVKSELLAGKRFDEIKRLTARAVALVSGIKKGNATT
jgi:2-dehydro-3-deoxyphosphogluconate aldolase / (4S)-4-hydroxy-2-oxoglutarate aldolase